MDSRHHPDQLNPGWPYLTRTIWLGYFCHLVSEKKFLFLAIKQTKLVFLFVLNRVCFFLNWTLDFSFSFLYFTTISTVVSNSLQGFLSLSFTKRLDVAIFLVIYLCCCLVVVFSAKKPWVESTSSRVVCITGLFVQNPTQPFPWYFLLFCFVLFYFCSSLFSIIYRLFNFFLKGLQ